jgi:hypothetical protein
LSCELLAVSFLPRRSQLAAHGSKLSQVTNVIFFDSAGQLLMNKGIIDLRNISNAPVFKQNIYSFITGIISGVDSFTREHKITCLFVVDG